MGVKGNVGVQRFFGVLSFDQIIAQAVPKQNFCPFYVSIQILYTYNYCLAHRLELHRFPQLVCVLN